MLFSFAGGRGHVEPLVPIARAVQVAGHVVAFTGGETQLRSLAALGFTVVPPPGPEPASEPPTRLPLQEVDTAREERDLRERFIRRAARARVPAVRAVCADWQPDVLVCDEADFGGILAAELEGLPYATVLVLAAGGLLRPAVVAEPLDELRVEHGLASDPTLAMLNRFLVLSPFPPTFRDPRFPLPASAHSFRAEAPSTGGALPWPLGLPEAPTVYFTLGTEFNLECGDLFTRVLSGLRDLPINVVVTVGSQLDPAEFAPLASDNILVERFVPQSIVLPHCAAVVSHGGSGSVLGALTHGLPQVLLPMGADQPANGERCAELGVGVVLDVVRATPAMVRDAVSAVLTEPAYRSAVESVQGEIAALPGTASAVSRLEQLVSSFRPAA